MLPQNSKIGYVYKIPIQDNAYGKMLVLKHKNCHDMIDTKWLLMVTIIGSYTYNISIFVKCHWSD